jgi:hypothetical protein
MAVHKRNQSLNAAGSQQTGEFACNSLKQSASSGESLRHMGNLSDQAGNY